MAGVPTFVEAHTRAPLVRQPQHTGACVGTQGVVARHVTVAHAATGPAFVRVFTVEAVSVVTILAPAEVGPVCVAAGGVDTAVVGQGGVLGALVHITALKARALCAGRAGTAEGTGRVSAAGVGMAAPAVPSALIHVYKSPKTGQGQGSSPNKCAQKIIVNTGKHLVIYKMFLLKVSCSQYTYTS